VEDSEQKVFMTELRSTSYIADAFSKNSLLLFLKNFAEKLV